MQSDCFGEIFFLIILATVPVLSRQYTPEAVGAVIAGRIADEEFAFHRPDSADRITSAALRGQKILDDQAERDDERKIQGIAAT